MHALYRRHTVGCRHAPQDHRRDARIPPLRARKPCHRSRPGRLHGNEKARGLLLSGLLRFTTAGSVDDGKSTLIGRLLYDSQTVYEDQLAGIRKATKAHGGLDLSLLTDGLRAEREQGITIDVAYRYFSTPRRKFIIADTPGHEQYTRNMATGASTADLAIVLIDARHGVLAQSRRHAFIASLLGIRHQVVAINKMDLVGYSEEVFRRICGDFGVFAGQIGNPPDLQFIPVSALCGDNVVTRSSHMPWYGGPALLEHLETVEIAALDHAVGMRLPVPRRPGGGAAFRPPNARALYRHARGRIDRGVRAYVGNGAPRRGGRCQPGRYAGVAGRSAGARAALRGDAGVDE
jgi:sulfate adenylyltransferase large subunit